MIKEKKNDFINSIRNKNFSKLRDINNNLLTKYLFLAEIPLITNQGTFVINGIKRIVILIKNNKVNFKILNYKNLFRTKKEV